MEWSEILCSKEINGLKNEIKGVVTAGQDPTYLSFQFVNGPGIAVHTFNPSIQKADAARSEFEASLVYRLSFRTVKLRQ